jgi:uncharacterized protein
LICPDVNVLISAFRTDSSRHRVCKLLLESEIASGRPFAIAPLALSAVIRITTTARFHLQPSTTAEAISFADALLSSPNCVVVEPGRRHWEIFKDLLITANARSKLVPDAHYAALAIEHGCEWITLDRDFGKFKGLKWRLVK